MRKVIKHHNEYGPEAWGLSTDCLEVRASIEMIASFSKTNQTTNVIKEIDYLESTKRRAPRKVIELMGDVIARFVYIDFMTKQVEKGYDIMKMKSKMCEALSNDCFSKLWDNIGYQDTPLNHDGWKNKADQYEFVIGRKYFKHGLDYTYNYVKETLLRYLYEKGFFDVDTPKDKINPNYCSWVPKKTTKK